MDKEIKGRLPPFTEALINHTKEKQFPFDTPGHHSGDFYNLTEEGKAFTMFRRDINKAISPMEIDHIDFIDSKCFKEEK